MSVLSVQGTASTPFLVVCNPLYPLTPPPEAPGEEYVFEVLEADADDLRRRIGHLDRYALDGGVPFSGRITSLVPVVSTHVGLALWRHRPALRGVLTLEFFLTR